MSEKINIPTPGVLYVSYVVGRERTYEPWDPYRFAENSLLILPEGVSAHDSRYEAFVEEHGLATRVLRNGYWPVALDGKRQSVHADFPLVEGFLSTHGRNRLAQRLGGVAMVIGEDLAAIQERARIQRGVA